MYYITKHEAINNTRMLTTFLKDPWTYISSIGTAFFISIQYMTDTLTPIITFFGAVIGIIVLSIGLSIKLKEKKNADLEGEIKRLELQRLKRELRNQKH